MPHKGLLSILRSKPLTDQDYLELLEARKAFIMESTDDIGQQKLGNVSIWRTRGDIGARVGDHLSEGDFAYKGKGSFSLNTRGVFVFDRDTYSHVGDSRQPDQTNMCVYGFTRSGDWLLAHIKVWYSQSRRVDKKSVYLHDSKPAKWGEFNVRPKNVLSGLSRAIHYHLENRRYLLEEAEAMFWQVKIEDSILGLDED